MASVTEMVKKTFMRHNDQFTQLMHTGERYPVYFIFNFGFTFSKNRRLFFRTSTYLFQFLTDQCEFCQKELSGEL